LIATGRLNPSVVNIYRISRKEKAGLGPDYNTSCSYLMNPI